MTKPSFFVVGAQKAGTTTLHDILKYHPQIFLPATKEAHFFDFEDRCSKGLEWWLKNFFEDCPPSKISGAVTPEYLFYEEVPRRICEALGQSIKIIIILRDPVSRAFSHYLMTKSRGLEPLSFEAAVAKEDFRLKTGGAFAKLHYSYIARGRYYEQVNRYIDIFGRKNVKVFKFEQHFLKSRKQMVEEIQDFLNIKKFDLNCAIKSNRASRSAIPFLSWLVHSDNAFVRAGRAIVGSKEIRSMVRKKMLQIHKKIQIENNENIDVSSRKKYLCLFKNDVKMLENLLKISFSEWGVSEAYKSSGK